MSVDIVRDRGFDYKGQQVTTTSNNSKSKAPIVTPQGALALGRLKNAHSVSAAMLPNANPDRKLKV